MFMILLVLFSLCVGGMSLFSGIVTLRGVIKKECDRTFYTQKVISKQMIIAAIYTALSILVLKNILSIIVWSLSLMAWILIGYFIEKQKREILSAWRKP